MYGYIYLTTNHVNGKRYIGRKTSTKMGTYISWLRNLSSKSISKIRQGEFYKYNSIGMQFLI